MWFKSLQENYIFIFFPWINFLNFPHREFSIFFLYWGMMERLKVRSFSCNWALYMEEKEFLRRFDARDTRKVRLCVVKWKIHEENSKEIFSTNREIVGSWGIMTFFMDIAVAKSKLKVSGCEFSANFLKKLSRKNQENCEKFKMMKNLPWNIFCMFDVHQISRHILLLPSHQQSSFTSHSNLNIFHNFVFHPTSKLPICSNFNKWSLQLLHFVHFPN